MQAKYCYIDFEFTGSNEKELNLVCCSLKVNGVMQSFWLQSPNDNRKELIEYLNHLKEDHVFVAYQVVAEARCFLTLGIDPKGCKWVDLHLEDKMLTNSNEKLGYGNQLLEGKVVTTYNYTKFEDEYSDSMNCSKPQRNYAACCFRFLNGYLVDTVVKNRTRDLIISKRENFEPDEIDSIIKYCESDVEQLPNILTAMKDIYVDYNMPEQFEAMYERAEYSALTAIMEARGYPVNDEALRRFQKNTAIIINSCMEDVTRKCSEMMYSNKYLPFEKKANIYKLIQDLEGFSIGMPVDEVKELLGDKYETRNGKKALKSYEVYLQSENWKMNQQNIRKWIEDKSGVSNWETTKTGQYSLAKNTWQKYYSFSHDYPDDKYEAQILRFLKLKESMNGFLPNSRKPITNNLGSDSRIRPYMNIYGAQSSRSQPSSSSFIFLKAAWSRALVHPSSDKIIVGIDYSSQEVLVQGLLTCMDQGLNTCPMIESYESGDVYLDFAKRAEAVPKDATKESHKSIRDKFKSTFLGIGYGMQSKSLARKLKSDTGEHVEQYEAQELIEDFYDIYNCYADYLLTIESNYQDAERLQLLDHWTLFGDNKNSRSYKNFMIQGNSAVIMRRAVKLCEAHQLPVIFTLHDALYIELAVDSSLKYKIQLFNGLMKQAFTDIFKHEKAKSIRTDVTCWGDYFKDNTIDESYEEKKIYIDERARKDYEFFSQYFIQ